MNESSGDWRWPRRFITRAESKAKSNTCKASATMSKTAFGKSCFSETFPFKEAIASRSYDGLLIRLSSRLEEQLKQVKLVVDQRRHDLMEAEKKVRVLEKLEEKERGRYDRHIEHVERELMDELAITAMQRRRESGEFGVG